MYAYHYDDTALPDPQEQYHEQVLNHWSSVNYGEGILTPQIRNFAALQEQQRQREEAIRLEERHRAQQEMGEKMRYQLMKEKQHFQQQAHVLQRNSRPAIRSKIRTHTKDMNDLQPNDAKDRGDPKKKKKTKKNKRSKDKNKTKRTTSRARHKSKVLSQSYKYGEEVPDTLEKDLHEDDLGEDDLHENGEIDKGPTTKHPVNGFVDPRDYIEASRRSEPSARETLYGYGRHSMSDYYTPPRIPAQSIQTSGISLVSKDGIGNRIGNPVGNAVGIHDEAGEEYEMVEGLEQAEFGPRQSPVYSMGLESIEIDHQEPSQSIGAIQGKREQEEAQLRALLKKKKLPPGSMSPIETRDSTPRIPKPGFLQTKRNKQYAELEAGVEKHAPPEPIDVTFRHMRFHTLPSSARIAELREREERDLRQRQYDQQDAEENKYYYY